MTVLEVIQRSTDFLARKGVESPRLQVELVLAHVLKRKRLQLYLEFERPLAPPELEQIREMIRRRGLREPLQHVLGTVSFCGLELEVNPQVLIPRPETESLAERAWTRAVRLGEGGKCLSMLDFGTGSGCLAIALAVHCPLATVVAVDACPKALATARANAQRHGVAERIEFRVSDCLSALGPDDLFDLAVANPPYLARGGIEALDPEVRDHDPRAALDGGMDGLDFFRCLAAGLPRHLRAAAPVLLEFGDGQEGALRAIFAPPAWVGGTVENDLGGRPRILIAERWAP